MNDVLNKKYFEDIRIALNDPNLPASESIDFSVLPPFLRMLLVMDGTVTKSLEAYFWEHVNVVCLNQSRQTLDHDESLLDMKTGAQVLRREVQLTGDKSKRNYLYAASIIRTDGFAHSIVDDLIAGQIGIGELLQNEKFETYRKIVGVKQGQGSFLKEKFSNEQWGNTITRTYIIYTNKIPCIQVTEYFPVSLYIESKSQM